MAVTGRFEADFTQFNTAVQQAELTLKGFDTGAGQVEKSLNRMVDNFTGRKIISEATLMAEAIDRIGGTSKLTAAELARVSAMAQQAKDKLIAVGEEVPPGIARIAAEGTKTTSVLQGMGAQLAGMFTVGAVISFGREVLAAGDQIVKMSDQTGIGTAEIQKMQFIAGQSGTSMESLIGAVQNMQLRVGDDSTGAAGAIKKLGINMDEFNKLGSYDQLTAVASAIQGVQNPTEQVTAAAAIFGKTWKEILPAIKSGMEDVGNQAPIMADATVKALDRVGDAMTAAKQQAVAWGGAVVLALEGGGFAIGDYLSQFDPAHWGQTNTQLLEHYHQLNDPDGIKGALQALPPLANQWGAAYKGVAMDAIELKRVEEELTASAKESMAQNKKDADALAAAQKNVADLDFQNAMEEKKASEEARQALDDEFDAAMRAANAHHANMVAAVDGETAAAEATKKHTDALKAEADAAAKAHQANRDMGNSIQYDLSTEQGRAMVPENVATWLRNGWSLEQAVRIALLLQYAGQGGLASMDRDPLLQHKGPRVPGFASGVENFTGGLALVGEMGPELVNLPRGSDVIPFGRGAGVNVYNTFNIVDTEAGITRRVSQNITRAIMQGQKLTAT